MCEGGPAGAEVAFRPSQFAAAHPPVRHRDTLAAQEIDGVCLARSLLQPKTAMSRFAISLHPSKNAYLAVACSTAIFTTTGCLREGMSAAEMRAAVVEIVENGQVQQLENGIVEITTDFTIGDAVEAVRDHIAEVLAACGQTTVTVMDDVSIRIDFGPASDPCVHDGKSYSGVVDLVITRDGDTVTVEHTYQDASNGTYTLHGDKTVTWSSGGGTAVVRTIDSNVGWTGPNGPVDHTSQRTMTFSDFLGGPEAPIVVDGNHHWTRDGEAWDLDMNEVEFRLVDPVPQDGSYVLTVPSGKEGTLSFERIDEDTIAVHFATGLRERTFHVTKSGQVDDAEG